MTGDHVMGWRQRLLTLGTLILAADWFLNQGAAAAGEAVGNPPAGFSAAGGFDWRRTTRRRPVFTVDYWPGVPAILKEGRADVSSDLQHLAAYADPVTVRTLCGSFNADKASQGEPGRTGGIVMPNLLRLSDPELRAWQQELRGQLQPLIAEYRKAGVFSIDLQMFFLSSGQNNTPAWYKEIPDWAECTLSGKPLDQPCLSHPKMYEVVDRTFQALSFLREDPVFLGFHLENEPHLGPVGDLADYGGNRYTKEAFREFLAATFASVAELNRLAGTSFPSFQSVDIADRNWLICAMAARFRSTLVTGVYQTRLAALAKKHFPGAVTMTRLETGGWLREQSGKREINGVEFTCLKNSDLDIISWSHLWNGRNPDGLGQLQVTGGLLRGVGKPIGFTEPHVLRYGGSQWGVLRPEELLHVIYRGLFYNFRMFNLHSWDRVGSWAIYNEPFGAVYSKHPGTLQMVAQLRGELDRIGPYETFGEAVMPPLRLLVSRNARHYPGMCGWFYGNWLSQLCPMLERPQLTNYEILEEQTGDVERALKDCRGVAVADACLSPRTRDLLGELVARGGRLLVFGAPATVDAKYAPVELPDCYPVAPQRGDLARISKEDAPQPIECRLATDHPLVAGLTSIRLLRPAALKLKGKAQSVAMSPLGETVAAAGERVVYLAGFPTDESQQRTLLLNFQRWCGLETPTVIISRFDRATVVQNWDTANHRLDGSVIDPAPFVGSIPLSGAHTGAIQELREDHPWLAYRRQDDRIILEGVRVDPKGVKVFRTEAARELPHFENIPDAIGFSFFWAGESHPIIGRFTVACEIDVDARIVGGSWTEDQISWYVCEIGQQRVAEGKGRPVRFHAKPGKNYYLTAVLPNHPQQEVCPLCRDCAFE